MNKLSLILLIALAGLLSACGGLPTTPEAPKNDYKVIPKSLLVKCHISPPPVTAAQYKAMNPDKREETLTKYANSLLADLDTCNIRMGEIYIANEKLDNLLNEAGSK